MKTRAFPVIGSHGSLRLCCQVPALGCTVNSSSRRGKHFPSLLRGETTYPLSCMILRQADCRDYRDVRPVTQYAAPLHCAPGWLQDGPDGRLHP
jgi:hypothetical protein